MYLYFDFENYNEISNSNHTKLLELSLEIHKLDSDFEITAQILNESTDPAMRDIYL